MSEAQTYYDGLITQGHPPESALQYTQQHFPGFVPTAGAPAPAPAPAMGAPAMGAPAMGAPMAGVATNMGVTGAATSMGNAMGVATEGKDWLVTLLLSIFVGTLGIDRFYLGHIGLGILKLITFGGCGIWWLIDLIIIVTGGMKDANGMPLVK
jgi:TM2 domain-containing membrane protein YozV